VTRSGDVHRHQSRQARRIGAVICRRPSGRDRDPCPFRDRARADRRAMDAEREIYAAARPQHARCGRRQARSRQRLTGACATRDVLRTASPAWRIASSRGESADSQADLLDDGTHARLQWQRFFGLRVDGPTRDECDGKLVSLPGVLILEGSNRPREVERFCHRPIPGGENTEGSHEVG
jgi:hypothetical protein